MELHHHNGLAYIDSLPENLKPATTIAVERVKGLYIRFTKSSEKAKCLTVGLLKTKFSTLDLNLCKETVIRYKLNEAVNFSSILYGVIYCKGLYKNSTVKFTTPIINFFNQSTHSTYCSWQDLETFCINNNLPISSATFCDNLDLEANKDFIVRPSEAYPVETASVDLKVHWHNLK